KKRFSVYEKPVEKPVQQRRRPSSSPARVTRAGRERLLPNRRPQNPGRGKRQSLLLVLRGSRRLCVPALGGGYCCFVSKRAFREIPRMVPEQVSEIECQAARLLSERTFTEEAAPDAVRPLGRDS